VDDFVRDLLDDVGGIGSPWLELLAFALAFGETAFLLDLIVPGEVGMVLVGAAAARHGSPLVTVAIAAALGATLGDSVGWLLGRYGVSRIIERVGWVRRRVEPKLEPARDYFGRRGGAAIVIGRFVGALRSVVAVVAGMSGMPYPRFLGWNLLASVLWAGAVVSAGYAFGANVDAIVSEIGLIISGAVLATTVVVFLVLRVRAKRHGSTRSPEWRGTTTTPSQDRNAQGAPFRDQSTSTSEARRHGARRGHGPDRRGALGARRRPS
jgi:membrane protein DedA with SNARE-associated domain